MRDITHFLLATLLSLATLACRHDTPPTDGPLSRQLPPRHRLKQKMPPEGAKGMDEWVRAIE